MPKLGMGEIRRKQLIDATYVVLHRDGMEDLTLKKIADEAGIVTSQITHYFGTKQALIEATMRDLVASLLREVQLRRRQADSVIGEVAAIVDGNFATSQTSDMAVAVWLYFWSRVPYEPEFQRLQKICDYQLRKYIMGSLRNIVPKREAESIAETIIALAYGLWLRDAHSGHTVVPANTAHGIALAVVQARIQSAWQDNLSEVKRTKEKVTIAAARRNG